MAEHILADWHFWARPDQIAPEGDWRVWMILAGRGFGKTRAGAEWVRGIAEQDGRARIALVAASLAEARSIMVEGDSGLLALGGSETDRPEWEPSLRRLRWSSGAVASLYSAAEPDSLRGPQHSHASRPGREGVDAQRGACCHRCAAGCKCRGYRKRSRQSDATSRAMLAYWRGGDRCLGRNGELYRPLDRLGLAMHSRPAGPPGLWQRYRRALCFRVCGLDSVIGRYRPWRRCRYRYGGPRRYRSSDRPYGRTWVGDRYMIEDLVKSRYCATLLKQAQFFRQTR